MHMQLPLHSARFIENNTNNIVYKKNRYPYIEIIINQLNHNCTAHVMSDHLLNQASLLTLLKFLTAKASSFHSLYYL